MFVLSTSIEGKAFYVGTIVKDRGRARPGLTSLVERAKKYKTEYRAMQASNAIIEKTGYFLMVIDAAELEGRP